MPCTVVAVAGNEGAIASVVGEGNGLLLAANASVSVVFPLNRAAGIDDFCQVSAAIISGVVLVSDLCALCKTGLYEAVIGIVLVGSGLSVGICALNNIARTVITGDYAACVRAVLLNAVSESVINIAGGIIVTVVDLKCSIVCIIAIADCRPCGVSVLDETIQRVIAVVRDTL